MLKSKLQFNRTFLNIFFHFYCFHGSRILLQSALYFQNMNFRILVVLRDIKKKKNIMESCQLSWKISTVSLADMLFRMAVIFRQLHLFYHLVLKRLQVKSILIWVGLGVASDNSVLVKHFTDIPPDHQCKQSLMHF